MQTSNPQSLIIKTIEFLDPFWTLKAMFGSVYFNTRRITVDYFSNNIRIKAPWSPQSVIKPIGIAYSDSFSVLIVILEIIYNNPLILIGLSQTVYFNPLQILVKFLTVAYSHLFYILMSILEIA